MVTTLLSLLTTGLGRLLPEGKFKGFLRNSYCRSSFNAYMSGLEALSKIVDRVELLEDQTIRVELTDGVVFYAPRDSDADHAFRYALKYGKPNKLWQVEELEYYWSLVAVLREIFVDEIYDQYYNLKKGNIIVDVGAHIGIFAVKAAKAVANSGGVVVAIEPDSKNLKFLERNIRENDLKNVIIVSKGAWSKPDKLKLYHGCYSMSSSFYHQQWQLAESTEVDVDTVDNIVRELGLEKVDFLKMDVEGAEFEVLRGMKEILQGNINLVISAYHEQDGEVTYKKLVPWLASEGFDVCRESGIVYVAKDNLKLVSLG